MIATTVGRSTGREQIDAGLSLKAIARWSEALQKHDRLEEAIDLVARTVGAELSLMLRFTANNRRPARLCVSGALAARFTAHPEAGEFSRLMLADYMAAARTGSVWVLSEHDRDATDRAGPNTARWMARAHIRDAVTVVLGRDEAATDLLEMQFTARLTRARLDFIRVFAASLADSWGRRQHGLVPDLLRHRRQHLTLLARHDAETDLLDPSNPAGLTRSEYRVCLLLKRGLRPAAVRKELGVSQSTLRTHLRHIYAKTENEGQVDLVFRLLKGIRETEKEQHKARIAL